MDIIDYSNVCIMRALSMRIKHFIVWFFKKGVILRNIVEQPTLLKGENIERNKSRGWQPMEKEPLIIVPKTNEKWSQPPTQT